MKTKILKFLSNGTINLKACNTGVYRQWLSEKTQQRLGDYLFELANIDEFKITRRNDSVLNLDLYKQKSIVWQGSIYLY